MWYNSNYFTLPKSKSFSLKLYQQIKGLGGFRNILVHGYLGIDTDQVFDNFQKGLVVFPLFAQEILAWLDAQFRV